MGGKAGSENPIVYPQYWISVIDDRQTECFAIILGFVSHFNAQYV